jgi:serine/threonine-protein kinase
MVGRYAIYDKIAAGGMAAVHLGRLVGSAGFARTVAIKRILPQFVDDPEFVSMFVDEARLAGRIRHPNVVPTLDVVAMDGELFLVMELIEGESLSRLIAASVARGERIAPATVAAILIGVLDGLHAAHDAKNERGEPLGIVHRDVSPQNVLVGIDGVARVLDFGVAKAVGRLQTTMEGQLKGKLPYMAPEQIRGDPATRATDVYAAAVLLWEALTAKRLFRGSGHDEVRDQVVRGCDVPPSRYVPDLPRAVDEVTMRGLEVNPVKRFPTAREMARALEKAISPATASTVGAWVEDIAHATLAERNAMISDIENYLSGVAPAPAAPQPASAQATAGALAPRPDPSVPANRPYAGPAAEKLEVPPASDGAFGSVMSSTDFLLAHMKATQRRTWVGVGAVAAGLLTSLLVALSRPSVDVSPAASETNRPLANAAVVSALPAISVSVRPTPAESVSASARPPHAPPVPRSRATNRRYNPLEHL